MFEAIKTKLYKHFAGRQWTRQEIDNVCRDINANSDFEVRVYDKKRCKVKYPVMIE